ncbi:tRNA threonylcarbamoyladenosine biosynthesis protein TsaE [Pedobacter cryoconitis]|uniref:tRNA (adenosine(37)-N6)-threonylcarbamoyltransferase complex ATPase subunit type 1 TsaE n=1 Tax=Pedobacter cryoconitis TaxID=188932 RepID=UPI0016212E14|nr:tRNA (adenosine(37)-N6)-threonylcarbamoyltransferase complex ATPase subunit type 1 TsaE [Pedobacter cryoconitis]MBB6273659.1 tRNA threonylcarbamoyladenosine biosynthesis protein TsaE [Pedobacter cryoconitis]
MNIEINHPDELGNAAEALLGFAGNEKIFAFEGEMGAGKTTFIKALCEKLGVKDVVSSPTFSIVNEYAAAGQIIYHFDFYRIKNLHEVFDIGYEEYFYSGHICLIEWPERIRELMPENYIEVGITALSEMQRLFSFTKI